MRRTERTSFRIAGGLLVAAMISWALWMIPGLHGDPIVFTGIGRVAPNAALAIFGPLVLLSGILAGQLLRDRVDRLTKTALAAWFLVAALALALINTEMGIAVSVGGLVVLGLVWCGVHYGVPTPSRKT
jgi:hypothetical protein